MLNYNLKTNYVVDEKNILKEYPRPLLKRNSYLSLNGNWKYYISTNKEIVSDFKNDILVPFCLESALSKVRKNLKKNEYLFYRYKFKLDKSFVKDITILHFDGIDQHSDIYLNDIYLGSNDNGYIPFSFDISKYIKDKNVLTIRVKDSISKDYPWGKQRYDRKGMWYTPVSGIWKSVWLESVNKNYIEDIKILPDIDKNKLNIKIKSDSLSFRVKVSDKGKLLINKVFDSNEFDLTIENPILWTPDNPYLYDLEITNNENTDTITSYFAMRKFSVDNKYFYLNNKKYFVNGLLDQGYFSDGIYTPVSYEAYKDDILKMKELGFNCLRKHIKIEPDYFYYLADKLGILIFQDFVNVSKYHFIKDTVIPSFISKKINIEMVSKIQQANFIESAKKEIELLYNHPCVVYYTIFNEGWGQFKANKVYDLFKNLDNGNRIFDTTSGWFKPKNSDVESLHVYFKPIKLYKSNKPIIVSEFGGYCYKDNLHSFNLNNTYGYRIYKNKDEFVKGFIKLYEEDILANIKNDLAGAIYTQVSDVEDETNGILTYDRKVNKLDKNIIKPLMDKIYKEFDSHD